MTTDQFLIQGESAEAFDALHASFINEHKPSTVTESVLVESLAQHHWFEQRAIRLQTLAFTETGIMDEKKFTLLIRYQSVNERAFSQALTQLRKLRADMVKELIGFESQKQKQALTEAKVRALDSKTRAQELDTEIRTTVEAPLPGNIRLPFDQMKPAFQVLVRELAKQAA